MGPGREIAFCVIAISRFVDNEPSDLTRQRGSARTGRAEGAIIAVVPFGLSQNEKQKKKSVHLVALKVTSFCCLCVMSLKDFVTEMKHYSVGSVIRASVAASWYFPLLFART